MSRTWRDVILYSPTFCTDIGITPGRANMSLMRARAERRRQRPLDITIRSWQNSRGQLSVLLNAIIPHGLTGIDSNRHLLHR